MNDQNLVLWAIDENMGSGHKSESILHAFLHRLSENTKTAITFCKNKKYISVGGGVRPASWVL